MFSLQHFENQSPLVELSVPNPGLGKPQCLSQLTTGCLHKPFIKARPVPPMFSLNHRVGTLHAKRRRQLSRRAKLGCGKWVLDEEAPGPSGGRGKRHKWKEKRIINRLSCGYPLCHLPPILLPPASWKLDLLAHGQDLPTRSHCLRAKAPLRPVD